MYQKRMNNGFYLRDIVHPDNDSHYGHLYNADDQQLSEEVFRIGGLGGTFKDGYCELIHYPKIPSKKEASNSVHVIINEQGDIVLRQPKAYSSDYPYLKGGHIVLMGKSFYNLLNGEILIKDYDDYMDTETNLLVHIKYEKKWSSQKDDEPQVVGVHVINKYTLEKYIIK